MRNREQGRKKEVKRQLLFPKIFSTMAAHDRMTIKQLGAKSDISEKSLSMKLNGKSAFKLFEMQKIQSVLTDPDGEMYSLDELFRVN